MQVKQQAKTGARVLSMDEPRRPAKRLSNSRREAAFAGKFTIA